MVCTLHCLPCRIKAGEVNFADVAGRESDCGSAAQGGTYGVVVWYQELFMDWGGCGRRDTLAVQQGGWG